MGIDFLRWRMSLPIGLPVVAGSPQIPSRSSVGLERYPEVPPEIA